MPIYENHGPRNVCCPLYGAEPNPTGWPQGRRADELLPLHGTRETGKPGGDSEKWWKDSGIAGACVRGPHGSSDVTPTISR